METPPQPQGTNPTPSTSTLDPQVEGGPAPGRVDATRFHPSPNGEPHRDPAQDLSPASPPPTSGPASVTAAGSEEAATACQRLMDLLETARKLEALEQSRFDDKVRLPITEFVAAQFRMRIQPALAPDWPQNDPVHLALCGGTNSGKSTILNVLIGHPLASMSPTARHSQHPEAYQAAGWSLDWCDRYPGRFEAAGYVRYRNQHPPRQTDADLEHHGYRPAYAVHDVAPPDPNEATRLGPNLFDSPHGVVCWDAPDISTEQARYYMSAVVDTLALADLILFAVTKESYADDRGLSFLKMLTHAGLPVLAVANKLPTARDEREEILPDIRAKLEAHRREPSGARRLDWFLVMPTASGDDVGSRFQRLCDEPAVHHLKRVARDLAAEGTRLKKENLDRVFHYVSTAIHPALEPLRSQVREVDRWRSDLESLTQTHLLRRYREEHLNGERYEAFDRTMIRVLELIQVPFVGRWLSKISGLLRKPADLLLHQIKTRSWTTRTPSGDLSREPEHVVLERLLEIWFNEVRGLAQAKADDPQNGCRIGWNQVARGLDSAEFLERLRNSFPIAYQAYREDLIREEETRATRIHEAIASKPNLLRSLKYGQLATQISAVAMVIVSGGFNVSDLVVAPLVATLLNVLVEGGVGAFVEAEKAKLRDWQAARIEAIAREGLVNPALSLFPAAVESDRLDTVADDLALIGQAVRRIITT